MSAVVLVAALPSVRLGLASMLADRGHVVLGEDEASGAAVWVLDAPDQGALDALTSQRYTDQPRAAVILTDTPELAAQLAAAGLRGWACLGRDADADELDLAVRAADAGLVAMDLPTAGIAVAPAPRAGASASGGGIEALTPRELQVLQLMAQGLPNKGIARVLGITENTAKFHVASVTAKLGASGRTEAVTVAARRGLILL